MAIVPYHVEAMLERLRRVFDSIAGARAHFTPSPEAEPTRPLRPAREASAANLARFWERLEAESGASAEDREILAGPEDLEAAPLYSRNIENYVGRAKLPMGVIGPLRVLGLNARGDYFIPLATTEAALVASYGRGAEAVGRAGGVATALLGEGVLRSPGFIFADILEAGVFVDWVAREAEALKAAAEATTRHGELLSLEPMLDSDCVFLLCRYATGDAAGQNMATIATQALCDHILEHTPVKPLHAFVEANFSGDKKASHLGLLAGRGRKVTASVTLPDEIIRRHLRAEPEAMLAYGRMANLGALLSGQIGAQAHYANGLAAFYIATGQDAACVAESAVGFTRMEPREGGLFFSATLPNILVGSVGGGTGLPTQAAALRILGLQGEGKAAALAEVTAALCLCGEISIIAAISAGEFTRAHARLARRAPKSKAPS
ncbi:3-hydroxy-3-methylglutaryl-CoA reductase [Neomegalonema sp.]|uniref:3-hydroxy-3-methylglutaryl-CoA reductase n=1 Tax=Neomegalonema sp. TaxID=2039713 RepID=UPI002604AE55|nr:3-hydroxy-3-methylglutaryl-CoA reductase [Neomegalonema sp.]MDD2867059.1 3-hydroxy-3-methylglutaryl-CoA reductase [Neomegalonema sp.]